MDELDVIGESAELQRRRKLQETLLRRAEESQQRASSGQGNILDALSGWKNRRAAERQNVELAQLEQANRSRYGQQLATEADNYLDASQGRPGSAPPGDGVGPTDPGQVANPRAAVIQAMTSRLPEMQALGKSAFGQLGAQEKPNYMNIDGTLVEVPKTSGGQGRNAGNFAKPEKPGDKFGPMVTIKGPDGKPVMGQWNEKDGQFHPKGAGGQTINVSATNAAQKAGLGEWSTIAAKTVGELSANARSAVNLLGQLTQAEKLSQAGTFGGPTAQTAVWLGQLARGAGIPMSKETSSKLQNSETFGNTAAELWLQTMNSNGGSRGLVKEESERIAANLPSLIQTPEGRAQMVAVMRQKAQQNIEDAQQANMQYGDALRTQDPAKFTFGLMNTTIPNTMPNGAAPGSVAGQPAGEVMTLEDYLKKHRGGK